MTETTQQKPKGPAPAGKIGDVAAWLKTVPSKDVTKPPFQVFEISDGPKGGPKEYGGLYANKYGHQITGQQACQFWLGDAVEVTLTGDKGDFKAILFPAERDVRLSGDQNQFKTTHVEIGRAFYRTTKPTADNPVPREFGYQIPDPSEFDKNYKGPKKPMVNFYMEYKVGVAGKNGGPQKTIEIDPSEAYRLLKGETLRFAPGDKYGVSGVTMKLDDVVVKGGKYCDAKVQVRFNDLRAEIGAWEQATGLKYEPKDKVAAAPEVNGPKADLPEPELEENDEPAIRA